jgi:hypothetical protein
MIKLKDYSENIEELISETNPFAIITAAHLQTKATKKDAQSEDIDSFKKVLQEIHSNQPEE